MLYNKGDKVRTGYGIGKIIDIKCLEYDKNTIYCYKVKYSIFKKLWCFEFSIEERISQYV